MKRNLLILASAALLLCRADYLHAQVVTPAHGIYPSPAANISMRSMNVQPVLQGRKTTLGGASRLIKIVNWFGPATSNRDSLLFNYSSGRGGYYTFDYYNLFDGRNVKFDSAQDYILNMSTGAATPNNKTTQVFDANNNVTLKTYKEWEASAGTWRDASAEQRTYDGENNLLTVIYQGRNASTGLLENTSKVMYAYAGSNLTSGIHQQWNQVSGAWENYTQNTYSYDAMNNMTGSYFLLWNAGTTMWENFSREINTYDGANNMLSKLAQKWNNTTGSWEDNMREIHTYDISNNNLSTTTERWVKAASAWVNDGRITYSSFTAHLPGQSISEVWDMATATYTYMFKNTYTYNSINQPTFFGQQNWDATSAAWNPNQLNQFFYYESYVSGVEPVSRMNGKANIYPVPASGSVTVAVEWDEPQAFTLTIIDLQGKVIAVKDIEKCSHYDEQLRIVDLPAGNYVIKMEGANGKIVQQMSVVR